MIKVIPDNTVQAEVEEDESKYRLVKCSDQILWEKVDSRESMEMHLLESNNRYLQQVMKEDGILIQ